VTRPAYQPDDLSASARRWLTSHEGRATPALRRVRVALAAHYGDMTVLDGITAWKLRHRPRGWR
jgi:hypothetical protein